MDDHVSRTEYGSVLLSINYDCEKTDMLKMAQYIFPAADHFETFDYRSLSHSALHFKDYYW